MNHYSWASVEVIANMTPHQQIVALSAIPGNDNPLAKNLHFDSQEDYLKWKAARDLKNMGKNKG